MFYSLSVRARTSNGSSPSLLTYVLPGAAVMLLLSAATSAADETIRRVQEELRRRQVFFGEIDGRNSPEVEAALRRFQERKGLAVTGRPDDDTLTSLRIDAKLAASNTAAASLPDGPILRSDRARELSEEDRKFLETLPSADSEPTEDEFAVQPVRAPAEPRPLGTPPPPAVAEQPTKQPWPDLKRFVQGYLEACERNEVAAEMSYYGDSLDYFDDGIRSEDFVRKDVLGYYRRWPERKYELLEFSAQDTSESRDEAIVRFRIRFHYRSPERQAEASGMSDNVFKVRRTDDGVKFVRLRERRVR